MPLVAMNDSKRPLKKRRRHNNSSATKERQPNKRKRPAPEPKLIPTGEDCPICLDPIYTTNLACLPCSHFFHKQCINTSLGYSHRCPICQDEGNRRKLIPEEQKETIKQLILAEYRQGNKNHNNIIWSLYYSGISYTPALSIFVQQILNAQSTVDT